MVIDTAFDGLFPAFATVAFGAPIPNLLPLLTGGAYGSDQISRNHDFTKKQNPGLCLLRAPSTLLIDYA